MGDIKGILKQVRSPIGTDSHGYSDRLEAVEKGLGEWMEQLEVHRKAEQ